MRTRLRDIQARDEDFLTEEESSQRFIFRDGYGENNCNLSLDGYVILEDIEPPNTPVEGTLLYSNQGILYTKNPQGISYRLDQSLTLDGYCSTENFEQHSEDSSLHYTLDEAKIILDGYYLPSFTNFEPIVKIGNTTQTTTVAVGRASNFSNIINFSLSVEFSKSQDTGNVTITNLPFTSLNTSGLNYTINVGGVGFCSFLKYSSNPQVQAILKPNSSTVEFSFIGSEQSVTDQDLLEQVKITLTGMYFK